MFNEEDLRMKETLSENSQNSDVEAHSTSIKASTEPATKEIE